MKLHCYAFTSLPLLIVAISCVSTATVTDSGGMINGVKWATRNVDKPGEFTVNPEDGGILYDFEKALTACPKGWRLPDIEEFASLGNINKVRSQWTTETTGQMTIVGRRFIDRTNNNSIFLPAAGYSMSNDNVISLGENGHYLSSTFDPDTDMDSDLFCYTLSFSRQKVDPINISWSNWSFSVRCVEE